MSTQVHGNAAVHKYMRAHKLTQVPVNAQANSSTYKYTDCAQINMSAQANTSINKCTSVHKYIKRVLKASEKVGFQG